MLTKHEASLLILDRLTLCLMVDVLINSKQRINLLRYLSDVGIDHEQNLALSKRVHYRPIDLYHVSYAPCKNALLFEDNGVYLKNSPGRYEASSGLGASGARKSLCDTRGTLILASSQGKQAHCSSNRSGALDEYIRVGFSLL